MTERQWTKEPATSDVPPVSIHPRPGLSPDVPLHRSGSQPHEPATADAPEPTAAPRPGLSPDVPLHARQKD